MSRVKGITEKINRELNRLGGVASEMGLAMVGCMRYAWPASVGVMLAIS